MSPISTQEIPRQVLAMSTTNARLVRVSSSCSVHGNIDSIATLLDISPVYSPGINARREHLLGLVRQVMAGEPITEAEYGELTEAVTALTYGLEYDPHLQPEVKSRLQRAEAEAKALLSGHVYPLNQNSQENGDWFFGILDSESLAGMFDYAPGTPENPYLFDDEGYPRAHPGSVHTATDDLLNQSFYPSGEESRGGTDGGGGEPKFPRKKWDTDPDNQS